MIKKYYQVIVKEWDCVKNPPKESIFYMNPPHYIGETVLEEAEALDAAQKELANLIDKSVGKGYQILDQNDWKYRDTLMARTTKKKTMIRYIRIKNQYEYVHNVEES